jgi:hypothetical protein
MMMKLWIMWNDRICVYLLNEEVDAQNSVM